MVFCDRVQLTLIAGKGGDGLVSWTREKYLPKGGPSGGNGGPGGSVYLRATTSRTDLTHLLTRRQWKAPSGSNGGVQLQQGAHGDDLFIDVPPGVVIFEDARVLGELTQADQTLLLCAGGRGGRGNASFKSSKQRAPDFAMPGDPGEEKRVTLELKLLADVGLVGLPNAGKSSLLNGLTADATHAEIGAYPFTTLTPNLGVIENPTYQRLTIADVPGIVEGAGENKGLGHTFLRHIERAQRLLFIVDGAGGEFTQVQKTWELLLYELEKYSGRLLQKPHALILNKIDLYPQAVDALVADCYQHLSVEKIWPVSAKTGVGVKALIEGLFDWIKPAVH